ncbi:hypothetical protein M422DRAFT_783010 [Sphaerobolus stellatus SS14]|uniref:UBC core domain-containing protein n=1 Tax=Sphaerobolus stellatus (strain SS14) TaxID=990650 RepID=A0A0C9TUT0_SPHS4|nr:hypothetical protein M422DRAFT_783010 [Sphaerobolus stellatus SS14]
MKEYLDRKLPGKVSPQLRAIDPDVPVAAWQMLRWCVASSTAYIEEIMDEDDKVCNISQEYRQFRFNVGAPDKEARYHEALKGIQKKNKNAQKYPALYAFHGSPMRNWHSIVREGLLLKEAINGRAFGNGVYFAKDASISMGTYATSTHVRWSKSAISPSSCFALAEIINSPGEFKSTSPYYVVPNVDWILCRYLLVKQSYWDTEAPQGDVPEEPTAQYMNLDPKQQLVLGNKIIRIPAQSQKLDALLHARMAECPEDEPFDQEDCLILSGTLAQKTQTSNGVESQQSAAAQAKSAAKRKAKDEWTHVEAWCDPTGYTLLPPPSDSTPQAALALQREFRTMLREQDAALKNDTVSELGWFMPPELMDDNLFRWMVELHSFDPSLPIAKDMANYNVPSFLFEIRFPDRFPIQPPFFRVIKPRVLPFAHGGGGHITAGGSICMDLLTSDGWLPSYSISAVLLQIRLAICNPDPRPARLTTNWQLPYSIGEALEGFKRAANAHGWRIPEGLEKLTR